MEPNIDDFLDLLKLLVREPAVVGAEDPFFRVLRRELEESAAKVTGYEGLLVAEGSEPESAYISAHIDRHGLICTGPNEFQYAAYVARNRGDLTGDSISEQTFNLISGRFQDQVVQAYEPWSGGYIGQGEIRNSYVCERRGNLVFEVDGLDYIHPGTPVAYLDRLKIQDGCLTAQLDNALTAAMLVYLFRIGFKGTALFTAQEEAGRSWRFLLEWFRGMDRTAERLLVLDTSPYPDRETAENQDVVLRHRDAHAVFNAGFVAELEAACQRNNIRYGYKDEFVAEQNVVRAREGKAPRSLGSTELGRISAASEKSIHGATLQVPTTDYHTPYETAAIPAVKATLTLLAEFADGSIREPEEDATGARNPEMD